jgi:threonine dehydratase
MTSKDLLPSDWNETKIEVNLEQIRAARERIKDIVPSTPITKSIFRSTSEGVEVFYKLENFNVTGSFKIRGAANALRRTSKEMLQQGVVAASAGNHAQGVAYVSNLLGVKARIFMPERTPMNKVSATKDYGAEVVLTGSVYDDAYAAALESQSERGGVLIHAFNNADVINGQGTVGLEILDQIPNVGTVLVPVGGGGLVGGVGCAIKTLAPNVKIIGVQTTAFPSTFMARKAGKIEAIPFGNTFADGIAVKRPSPRTLALSLQYVDDVVLVNDDEIAAAVMSLMEKDHLLSEGAGAVGVAALSKIGSLAGVKGPICCVISGGNIDVNLLTRLAARGQIATGRLMLLTVRTKDKPGQLADILKELSKTGANLIEVRHQRTFGAMYYSDVDVELELETVDFKHQEKIKDTLLKMNVQIRS